MRNNRLPLKPLCKHVESNFLDIMPQNTNPLTSAHSYIQTRRVIIRLTSIVPFPSACVGERVRDRGVVATVKFLLVALLLLTVSACGGLAGEPRIVSTAPLPTVTPTAPPDLGH